MPSCEFSLDCVHYPLQLGKVAVVKAAPASELPDSLDRIEFRAVGRQEFKAEPLLVGFAPVPVQSCVVIGGIIQDDDDVAPCGSGGAVELTQEVEEGLRPKPLGLAAVDEAPVAEADGAKVAHALPRGVVEQDGVSGFGWDPESAT